MTKAFQEKPGRFQTSGLSSVWQLLMRNPDTSTYSRIAVPRDSGHLVREDINIERAVVSRPPLFPFFDTV